MPQPTEQPQRLEIKKYPNRRYYDATRSRHLTLEEINAAIREGYEIRVVDSRTGEDITAKVLAQIIIDLDPPKLEVFPVPMLHGLLRANQKMIGDFIQRYFNQPLAVFLDSQRNFENYLRTAMGLPGNVPTMSDWTRMMWGPLAQGAWATPRASPPAEETATPEPTSESSADDNGAVAEPPGKPAPAHDESEQLRSTMEQLRKQVDQLQAELRRKGKKSGKAKSS